MGVEKVVRFLAPPLARQPHHVDQHFREGVAGHRAIGAPLHLEIEEQAAVAGKNRNAAQLALLLKSPKGRNLFQARPILVLQHDAGRIVGDDPADDVRGHHDTERQRIVLNDKGDVRADRFDGLRVISHDLIVGAQRRRRGDHHAGRAFGHGGVRQGAHRGKPGRGDADDERQFWRARNAAGDEADRLIVIELRRFAHDAENGAAVGASGDVVVDHAVDAGRVDAAVGEKRGGRDWKDAFGVDRKHGIRLGSKGWRDDGGRAALLASEGGWRKFRRPELY